MKKQILSEEFKRMQQLAGVINENNNYDSLSLQSAKNDQNPGLYHYLFSSCDH